MNKQHNNFDAIAKVYNLSRGYPEEVMNQIQKNVKSILPTDQSIALEIGAGTGLFTQYVYDYFDQYVAVDISKNMLSQLKELLNDKRILPMVADATQLPFLDQNFPVVMASKVLRHIANWEQSLCEFKRVIRPGGVFIHAEEAWLEKPEASEIRPKWKEMIRELGYEPNQHPGPTNNDAIVAGWKNIGAKRIDIITLGEWDVESQPSKVIDHLERRGGSSVLGLPDHILTESIQRLREWSKSRWHDLETIEVKKKCLQTVVVHF